MTTEDSSLKLSHVRLVVMNGQRILQSDHTGEWTVMKVGKAHGLKPGFYNLSSQGRPPTKTESYEGPVLHADNVNVWQQTRAGIVVHQTAHFGKLPEIAAVVKIAYDDKHRALVSPITQINKQSRSVKI